ncbi:MAG: Rieske (2Fe-2S) protein, partial [Paracraurococcus sp.]
MGKHVVAAVSELPPGSRRLTVVRGRPIAVFNLDGEFFALVNRCPHQGAGLCEGEVTGLVTADGPGRYRLERPGEIIRCPWHGWEFDIRTGQSYCDPRRFRVKAYPAHVEPGTNVVKGPYVAETVTVKVESDY